MSDIQRYRFWRYHPSEVKPNDDGEWVKLKDHLKAIEELEIKVVSLEAFREKCKVQSDMITELKSHIEYIQTASDGYATALGWRNNKIKELKAEVATLNDAYTKLWAMYGEKDDEVERLRGGWISVDDRTPTEGQRVLVTYAGVYDYDVVTFWTDSKNNHYGHRPAAHWQPLPQPPTSEYL